MFSLNISSAVIGFVELVRLLADLLILSLSELTELVSVFFLDSCEGVLVFTASPTGSASPDLWRLLRPWPGDSRDSDCCCRDDRLFRLDLEDSTCSDSCLLEELVRAFGLVSEDSADSW